MKIYVQLSVITVIWVLCLTLFIVNRNNTISQRVDEIRTYNLKKVPPSFSDVWYSIQQGFSQYWPDDTCYTLSTTLNASATCLAQRQNLVSRIVTSLQCDKYASQACKCVAQVNLGLVNPASGNNGKNLAGKRDSTLYAIESCRWLMHNANVAVSSGDVMGTRTALLLIIATIILCNVLGGLFLMTLKVAEKATGWSIGTYSFLAYFIGAGLSFGVTVGLHPTAYILPAVIVFTPFAALLVYEFLMYSKQMEHKPYIHPYTFGVVLGALSFMALVENGVTDYDIILFEILKCQAVVFIYIQVIWKYMSVKGTNDTTSAFEENGTLRAVLLACTVYLLGLLSPYTLNPVLNVMWYAPAVWVLFVFGSVTWICTFNYTAHPTNTMSHEEKTKDFVSVAHQHVALLTMLFLFVLFMYYVREHSLVYRVLIDLYPPNSLQLNATALWAHP